jgi:transposase
MSTDASPDDLNAQQRQLQEIREQLTQMQHVLEQTLLVCDERGAEIARLKAQLEMLQRDRYGRRSERHAPEQGRLFEEPADGAEPDDEGEVPTEEIKYRRRRRGYGWGKLPPHLPREEVLVDLKEHERRCECCGETLVRIGEDRHERVELEPARVFVKVIVRPKYACPHKHGVQQAPAPPSPAPGGRFDFGFTAHVVISKIVDHLPLYRQQDILARSGLPLGRSTLCEIMAHASELLRPLAELMQERLLLSDLLGADDTPVRLLDATHPEGVRLARFWLFRGFAAAPYNIFRFHESRSRDGPREFLQNFRGVVKVDAYGVDDGVYLSSHGRIIASCCMAHARRKFDAAKSSHPRIAAEALAYFQQLYDLEDQARLWEPEARRQLRECEATPVLNRFQDWLAEQSRLALPRSVVGEAIGYTLRQWTPLTNYVEDGRRPIDNNDTERDLRALTIGRKNWLFVGHPQAGPRAAVLYTVAASAARHDLDLWAYLRATLEHLARNDVPLTALLPDVWAQAHPEQIRTYRQHEREARAAAERSRRARRRRK